MAVLESPALFVSAGCAHNQIGLRRFTEMRTSLTLVTLVFFLVCSLPILPSPRRPPSCSGLPSIRLSSPIHRALLGRPAIHTCTCGASAGVARPVPRNQRHTTNVSIR